MVFNDNFQSRTTLKHMTPYLYFKSPAIKVVLYCTFKACSAQISCYVGCNCWVYYFNIIIVVLGRRGFIGKILIAAFSAMNAGFLFLLN